MTEAQRQEIAKADKLSDQGSRLLAAKKMDEALAAAKLSLEIRLEAVGRGHPQTTRGLHGLGIIYYELGDYASAEPLLLEALAIRERNLGPEHPKTGIYLSHIAHLYRAGGDYAKAELYYRRCLQISEKNAESKPEDIAVSLVNVAAMNWSLGDYATAEPFYLRALDIVERLKGADNGDVSSLLTQLGLMYCDMQENAKAEAALTRALAIDRKIHGPEHRHTAISLHNLALVYFNTREYDKAEPLLIRALDIVEQRNLRDVRLKAHANNALGMLYFEMGEFAKAEPLLLSGITIAESAHGPRAPESNLGNLALLYQFTGQHAKAEPLVRGVIDRKLEEVDAAALAQSDRQQLAMNKEYRYVLDHYVDLAIAAKDFDAAVYTYWLAWKGSVFTRQRLRLAQNDDPELAAKFAELQAATRRLATLALQQSSLEDSVWQAEVEECSQLKERLERELTRESLEFRKARERTTPKDIQAALGADSALIDFVQYYHSSPPRTEKPYGRSWQQRIAAFVVRKDEPVKLLDLGSLDDISSAVAKWRKGSFGATQEAQQAAAQLRIALWRPLEAHLQGVTTVFLSPEGELNSMPFAALPGRKKGTYLIEDFAIGVVPVPSGMAVASHARPQPSPMGGLFAVGEIDYDRQGAAGESPSANAATSTSLRAVIGDKGLRFGPLAGTGAEVIAIGKVFRAKFPKGKLVRLRGDQATEAAFCAAAPLHTHLHLATHGFFADPAVSSALARDMRQATRPFASDQRLSGYHPDLLSGVALAGANRPAPDGSDDGILTAAEVQSLDLRRVEMVSLSACETGLGQSAGGEGLLGLQRAFQVAGAKHVVASLWKVDDAATQALMTQYYRNLWEQSLPPIEALRQAQLQMMVHYEPSAGRLRAGFQQQSIDEKVLADARAKLQQGTPQLQPPFYWAAFVLSGSGK